MLVSPSPGNSITIAPTRANTSMKAAASAGSSETSMRMIERIVPQPPMIRDEIRIMWECSASAMNGSASSIVDEDRQDLRHEHQRLLLDLRQRLEQRHRRRRPRGRPPSAATTRSRWSRSHRARRRGFQVRSFRRFLVHSRLSPPSSERRHPRHASAAKQSRCPAFELASLAMLAAIATPKIRSASS